MSCILVGNLCLKLIQRKLNVLYASKYLFTRMLNEK